MYDDLDDDDLRLAGINPDDRNMVIAVAREEIAAMRNDSYHLMHIAVNHYNVIHREMRAKGYSVEQIAKLAQKVYSGEIK